MYRFYHFSEIAAALTARLTEVRLPDGTPAFSDVMAFRGTNVERLARVILNQLVHPGAVVALGPSTHDEGGARNQRVLTVGIFIIQGMTDETDEGASVHDRADAVVAAFMPLPESRNTRYVLTPGCIVEPTGHEPLADKLIAQLDVIRVDLEITDHRTERP